MRIILLLALLLVGCSTQHIPMPAPMPCEVKVKNECRTMSSSEQAGASSRGHSDNTKEPQ